MDEIAYGHIGVQKSDEEIHAIGRTRPAWLLRPLPLQQVNPRAYGGYDFSKDRWNNSHARGAPDSLASSCLAVISQNLHHYDPSTLTSLEPHLATRVMRRVCDDRQFAQDTDRTRRRPDDATIWTFIALSDPESAVKHLPTHTLGLPIAATVPNLAPSRDRAGIESAHPIIAAPYLFRKIELADKFAFLTTLQLDGSDDIVTDESILALRYATHLTGLWTRGCRRLTDDGVRMLAASLRPPNDADDAQGLWRLRAWWLTGCMAIGDRSMKSFAKWPGLVLLDVRDTSCTEVATDIYNRTNDALWGGVQPPFQHVNDGLRGLFTVEEPEKTLGKLCETLIKPDIPVDADAPTARRWLSLHLTASAMVPEDDLLPWPKTKTRAIDYSDILGRNGGTYRAGGIGHVYGHGAQSIPDEARWKRSHLALALELQAEDAAIATAIARGEAPPERRFDRERREWEKKEREEKARLKRKRKKQAAMQQQLKDWAADNPDSGMPFAKVYGKGAARDVFGTKRKNATGNEWLASSRAFVDKSMEAEARSRAFVKGTRATWDADQDDGGPVRGSSTVMLVRMVHPEWETMRYVTSTAAVGEIRAKRRAGAMEGIADMLMATYNVDTASDRSHASTPSASTSTATVGAASIPDSQPTQTQKATVSPFSQPPASQTPSQSQRASFNPFRAKKASSSGVTKLGAHICPEVVAEPHLELEGNTAKRQRLAGSGVMPLKSASGVVPLKVSGVVPLKSSTPTGVVPLKSSSNPFKSSSNVVPLKTKSKPLPAPAPRAQPAAKSEPKSRTKAGSSSPAAKETQTKLNFFMRKT